VLSRGGTAVDALSVAVGLAGWTSSDVGDRRPQVYRKSPSD
jgi:hypothetical protein